MWHGLQVKGWLTVPELRAFEGIRRRRGEQLLQEVQRTAAHDREGAVEDGAAQRGHLTDFRHI